MLTNPDEDLYFEMQKNNRECVYELLRNVKIYIFAHVESYVSHVIRGLLNSLLRCRNKQGYISKNDCERS